MAIGMTEKLLQRLYVDLGKSDKEIADFCKVSRTAISKLRKDFGIKTRVYTGEKGDLFVIKKLESKGYDVEYVKLKDKTSPFDLIVNDKVKIDVKASAANGAKFSFSLADRKDSECIESEHRIKLMNGKTRKLFRKTCDFLVLVGINDNKARCFVVPSNYIQDKMQTISIPVNPYTDNEYYQFHNKWGLIDLLINKR